MSYNVDNIVQITASITPQGLGFANFGKAVLFAPESELPVGFNTDTYRVYNTITDVSVDFISSTETYKAANKWLGGIPATNEITVYAVADLDADWATTLDKARNQVWWYWSFFTSTIYANLTDVGQIASWCATNESYFMNCQTGVNSTAIRDIGDSSDIASTLTTSGYRHASTFPHASEVYAGIAAAKYLAAVNYSNSNSTITLFGKKIAGTAAESLTSSEYNSMELDTKKAMFYTVVDNKGSTDNGRIINPWSHSTFGEFIDDVVNLDAFINFLEVQLYNTVVNATTKIPQTPSGQSLIIQQAGIICEQFISNGYLGPRTYIDPDDGIEKTVPGYQILSKPEHILNLLDSDRNARKSAPLNIRIFRAGAIHKAIVDVAVF